MCKDIILQPASQFYLIIIKKLYKNGLNSFSKTIIAQRVMSYKVHITCGIIKSQKEKEKIL